MEGWKDPPCPSSKDVCLNLFFFFFLIGKIGEWYTRSVVNQGLPERTFIEYIYYG